MKKPTLFFQLRPTPPIVNNYYNVHLPYYSNPSYYSGLESTCICDILEKLSSKLALFERKQYIHQIY